MGARCGRWERASMHWGVYGCMDVCSVYLCAFACSKCSAMCTSNCHFLNSLAPWFMRWPLIRYQSPLCSVLLLMWDCSIYVCSLQSLILIKQSCSFNCLCMFITTFDVTQFFIAVAILLGVLEKTFYVAEYAVVNAEGVPCECVRGEGKGVVGSRRGGWEGWEGVYELKNKSLL